MKATKHEAATVAYAHVASLLFGAPLAVTPDRARILAGYLASRMYGDAGAPVEVADLLTGKRLEVALSPDGIAVLSLRGTLTPKGSSMDALSGLVGYDALTEALAGLATDPTVRGVVLAMDSPGGAVMGVSDAAAGVKALAAVKPVFAVADHVVASAAYWVAAHAQRIFVAQDGFVGSIGTIIVREDATAADAQAGRAFAFISNMDRKSDGSAHKALGADELAASQKIIDQADALFLGGVAEARGMRGVTVAGLADLNGELLMGRAAVDAHLADAVGTVDDALAAMRQHLTSTAGGVATRAAFTAATAPHSQEAVMAETTQAAAAPSNVVSIDEKKIREEATAQATSSIEARTNEIVELCGLAKCPERAMAFVQNTALSAADVRKKLNEDAVAADTATAVSNQTNARRAGDGSGPSIDASAIYARRTAAYAQARDRRTQQMRAAIG
jgi:signal peptide peptidase SppA